MKFLTENSGEINIIGLKIRTTNENNQSSSDIYNLWDRFFKENAIENIPNKNGNEMYGVYFEYEGDYTKPYSYIVGCKVNSLEEIPDGLNSIVIPPVKYAHIIAKGKIPDCIMNVWREIWESDMDRAYNFDFEIYGEKSQDQENAEVDLYLSIK